MQPKAIKIFPVNAESPLYIDNWQAEYAETYGNRPSLLFLEKTKDDAGLDCEREFADAGIYRYYDDPPRNTKLNRIKILTESPLVKELIVTIKS